MTEVIYIAFDKKEDLLKIAEKYGKTGFFKITPNMTRNGLRVTIEGNEFEVKSFIEEIESNSIL